MWCPADSDRGLWIDLLHTYAAIWGLKKMAGASAPSPDLSFHAMGAGSGSRRAAQFVSRVGALAVALGVGVGVGLAPTTTAARFGSSEPQAVPSSRPVTR